MANKYTQIFSTKPVSTYRPLPIEHFSNLSQQIRQRYDTGKAEEARARLLSEQAQSMFTDPILREAAGERAASTLSEVDNLLSESNLEDSPIELKMKADRLQDQLANYQQVEQSKAAHMQSIVEGIEGKNLSVDEGIALYGRGDIAVDPETGAASFSASTPSFVKRVDPTQIITQRGGPKAESTFYTDENGRTIVKEGVTPFEADQVAANILRSSPEWRASQKQDFQIYANRALNAEGGPEAALEQYVESLPAHERSKARERIDLGRSQDMNDAVIYADLRTSDQAAEALDYAVNRFAFSSLTPRADGSGSGGSNSAALNKLMRGVTVNNPYMVDKPETMDFSTITTDVLKGTSEFQERFKEKRENQEDSSFDPVSGIPMEPIKIKAAEDEVTRDLQNKFRNMPLEELATTEAVKNVYGGALETLVNENPRQGESEEEYRSRINQLYQDANQRLASTNDVIKPISPDDFRGTGSLQEQVLGNPADPRDVGLGTELLYMVTTPGEEVESLNSDQLAERLGFNSSKELFDNMRIVGEFTEQSGLTGWEMRMSKEGGWFSNAKTYSIKGLYNEAGNEYRAQQLSKINQMKLDLGYNEPLEVPIRLDGQEGNVVIKPENVYVGEGQDRRFAGRRIAIQTQDGVYYEGDPVYDAIINSIK